MRIDVGDIISINDYSSVHGWVCSVTAIRGDYFYGIWVDDEGKQKGIGSCEIRKIKILKKFDGSEPCEGMVDLYDKILRENNGI